jgi:hypothetical protein
MTTSEILRGARSLRDELLAMQAEYAGRDDSRWDWYATTCPHGLPPGDCTEHPRARPSQRPPETDWRTFVYMAGRGSGKTRAGAEFVIDRVERGLSTRPILVGQTSADVRDVMVRTILDVSPPWFRPRHFPSRRALVWPNGVSALLISAEDPEQARGPNADLVWADEMGAWSRARETWHNLSLALRKGKTQAFVSTTPRRIQTLVDIVAQPTTVLSTESTLANRQHLSPEFVDQVLALYKGTRFEDQEIKGLLIDQAEGAWFGRFDPAKHVSESAVFRPGVPVEIAVDAGTSRTTAAVIYQTWRIDKYRVRFDIIADYLAVDKYSGENAGSILRLFGEVCPGAKPHFVWMDPASNARTSIGPTAIAEYQNVFGDRSVAGSPGYNVADGLDSIEAMLDRGDLVISPRCESLIEAFKNYSRASIRGQWLDVPALNQSPWEDPIDALRYGIRGTWPEGRRPEPDFHRMPASQVF